MTVVCATDRFIAADRRVLADYEKSTLTKVAKNEHIIAAVAGDAVDCLAMRRALRAGAKTPKDVAEAIDARVSHALVLTRKGQLFVVEEGEVWPQKGFYAIGSGSQMVLGHLAGACGRRKPTEKDARRAMRYVFRMRADCGDGIDVRSFG